MTMTVVSISVGKSLRLLNYTTNECMMYVCEFSPAKYSHFAKVIFDWSDVRYNKLRKLLSIVV